MAPAWPGCATGDHHLVALPGVRRTAEVRSPVELGADAAAVGGKAASFGTLSCPARVRVPLGFCVTASELRQTGGSLPAPSPRAGRPAASPVRSWQVEPSRTSSVFELATSGPAAGRLVVPHRSRAARRPEPTAPQARGRRPAALRRRRSTAGRRHWLRRHPTCSSQPGHRARSRTTWRHGSSSCSSRRPGGPGGGRLGRMHRARRTGPDVQGRRSLTERGRRTPGGQIAKVGDLGCRYRC